MGEGDARPAGGWQRERADVLTELALVSEAVRGLRTDWSDWKEQDRARQEVVNQLLQTCSQRGAQLESTRLKVDELQGRMKVVEGAMPAVKAMMWVGAALGVSVIALVWSLITGQAQVMFR